MDILNIFLYISAGLASFFLTKAIFAFIDKNQRDLLLNTESSKEFIVSINTNKYLKKMSSLGYMYRHGYNVEVSTFLFQKAICLFVFFIAVSLLSRNILFGAIAALIGFNFLDVVYEFQNNLDNSEMDEDINDFRDMLIVHSETGSSIKETLALSVKESKSKRFKQALNELLNHISSGNLTVKEALIIFENRFKNKKIKTLSSIISQSEETGRKSEMLAGLIKTAESEQVADNYKKEERLKRKMMFILLLYFVFILGTIMYGIVSGLTSSVGTLF